MPPPTGRHQRATNPPSFAQHCLKKLYLHQAPFCIRDTPKDRFTFDLTVDVPGIEGALDCEITSGWTHLTAAFALSIDGTVAMPAIVGVQLPPITLDDACDLNLTLDVSNDGFDLSIDGTCTFQGEKLTTPKLQLDESFTNLEDLPQTMLKHLEDEAKTIFRAGLAASEHLIVTYGDDAINYLEDVADDIKNFVQWVLGIHHNHKPAWLKNCSIVQAGAYSDVIRHCKRRHIPDPDTLSQLVTAGASATQVGPILASIPLDDVQMPSRRSGMVVTRKDDAAQFLIIKRQERLRRDGVRCQIQAPGPGGVPGCELDRGKPRGLPAQPIVRASQTALEP